MTEELTPEELEALKKLPRERMPSAGLEDRVVGALRESDVLSRRRRRTIEVTNGRVIGVLAAGIAMMIGAYSIGFHRGGEPTPPGTNLLQDRVIPLEQKIDTSAPAGKTAPARVEKRRVEAAIKGESPKSESDQLSNHTDETQKDAGVGSQTATTGKTDMKKNGDLPDRDHVVRLESEGFLSEEEALATAAKPNTKPSAAPETKTSAPVTEEKASTTVSETKPSTPEPETKPSAPEPVAPKETTVADRASELDDAIPLAQALTGRSSVTPQFSQSKSARMKRSVATGPRVETLPGSAVVPEGLSARPFRFLLNGQAVFVENPDEVRVEQEDTGERMLVIHTKDVIYRVRLER